MDDLTASVESLGAAWASAFTAMAANPAAYTPYLPHVTLEQVDEVVKTTVSLVERQRAPRGFAPGFHVGRALAVTSLANATNAAQALNRGEYGHLPSFLVALGQMLSAFSVMLSFADESDSRALVANLGNRLAESLALLDTAQSELARKAESLASTETLVEKAETWSAELEEKLTRGAKVLGEIEEQNTSATELLKQIRDAVSEAATDRKAAAEDRREAEELLAALKEAQKENQGIQEEVKAQQDLITALLPKGASAGLASAFAERSDQLERTKWIWMILFVGSVISLGFISWTVFKVPLADSEQMWRHLLHRLPVAAPLVWLGWFSAIQYGNTLRVQEDYAFKEATSKAFAGYKDHMDHLASVNLEDGNNAMNLLAARTIEVLSQNPLRLFQGSDKDASPSSSMLEAILGKKKDTES